MVRPGGTGTGTPGWPGPGRGHNLTPPTPGSAGRDCSGEWRENPGRPASGGEVKVARVWRKAAPQGVGPQKTLTSLPPAEVFPVRAGKIPAGRCRGGGLGRGDLALREWPPTGREHPFPPRQADRDFPGTCRENPGRPASGKLLTTRGEPAWILPGRPAPEGREDGGSRGRQPLME